jgi:hypothetical protein
MVFTLIFFKSCSYIEVGSRERYIDLRWIEGDGKEKMLQA